MSFPILELIFATALFIGLYAVKHTVFDVCLSDDVEFHHGKSLARKQRRNATTWLHRFLFLYIKNEVIRWHYVFFWINLVSSFAAIIALDLHIIFNNQALYVVFLISEGISSLTTAVISFCRWELYRENKVRNRKKYRK